MKRFHNNTIDDIVIFIWCLCRRPRHELFPYLYSLDISDITMHNNIIVSTMSDIYSSYIHRGSCAIIVAANTPPKGILLDIGYTGYDVYETITARRRYKSLPNRFPIYRT